MNNTPPDYILARPEIRDVPTIMASGDKCNLDELKELKIDGTYLYKLVKSP